MISAGLARYALGGALAGALGMLGLLAIPPVDPPGATPIRVAMGGGRFVEHFEIRPKDIIARTGDESFLQPVFPAGIDRIGGGLGGSSVLTALLRNVRGEVIGIASRYTVATQGTGRPDRMWTLVLTRRGTLATNCREAASCGTVLGGAGSFSAFRGRLTEAVRGKGYALTLTGAGER